MLGGLPGAKDAQLAGLGGVLVAASAFQVPTGSMPTRQIAVSLSSPRRALLPRPPLPSPRETAPRIAGPRSTTRA